MRATRSACAREPGPERLIAAAAARWLEAACARAASSATSSASKPRASAARVAADLHRLGEARAHVVALLARAVRAIPRRMRWSIRVDHLAARDRAAVRASAACARAARRAPCAGTRRAALSSACDVRTRSRAPRSGSADTSGSPSSSIAPVERVLGEDLDHQHAAPSCAIMRSSVSSSSGKSRSALAARPRRAPSCAAARRPGSSACSSARSRAASHICLWPPSSRKPDSSRACASNRPSPRCASAVPVDRLDHERAQVGQRRRRGSIAPKPSTIEMIVSVRTIGSRTPCSQQQLRLRDVRVVRRHQRARRCRGAARPRARAAPARPRSPGARCSVRGEP